MSRSSEEVLLIVNNVRNKKSDGTMYMMGERMAWMQESKNSFSISHYYADIKVQKISPDTKPKVQLQVVKHDGSADTFHFTNPMGRDAQSKDRENIKELLQQLLPKFRVKVNSELEHKTRMLQEDPELFQLYKDLVVAEIVTAEEFWANRVQKSGSSTKIKQEVGISAAFLADIQPQTDGCNGLKYNLTTDIIESIFRTYPAVKKKHLEYVPDKLAEAEFWTKFFQSHYFHRDRINFTSKDLFADCAKSDDKVISEQMSKNTEDPLVDLNYMVDNDVGEGYGMEKESDKKSINTANASLIRRFNQHSTMVLQAGQRASSSAAGSESHTNGNTPSTPNSSKSNHKLTPDHSDQPPMKKVKLKEKTEYEDLESPDNTAAGPALRLKRADRYLHGPTPAQAVSYINVEDMGQQQQAVRTEIYHWQPSYRNVLPSSMAVSILSDLSPGGAMMKTFSEHQLHQLVGGNIEDEVRHTYSALLELLRHFWACFPTSSPHLEEKVIRMRTNLERFHQAKLNPVKERLAHLHFDVNLAGHMEEMLAAAYGKFNTWQTRRMNRGK